VETVRPWALAKAAKSRDGQASSELDQALATLVHACRTIADELSPFLPDAAARIAAQCGPSQLPEPRILFPRIDV
jgi:methionyl-tRNA synthetase